ncbi:unnamed protein product [Rotaria sp. Silwood1]|nr:unnamed protein product [Rotaria sp. Silwood1]CAF1142881.1 unnamed protein product [Rotaria sp. Silwood1]CAF3344621.1 unnamed protein product [Rotaria sp. Silwood1]CAF4520740.1 unnamed protein product [Rotaria sp. Silwood1]CAF4840199.1 unnamed protein product [Rotaria sp. Silwood1]
MIDAPDNCISNCFLCNIMEQCSRQCIRRTFYAVLVGVSPIVICLLFIGLARLILYRLEIAYYRRQKITDRRTSLLSYQSGRLALSYTPVSNAEIQRIIQGEYQNQLTRDPSSFVYNSHSNIRKAPRFIRSLLPKRESALPAPNIIASLVMRRNALDAGSVTGILAPIETPLQPTFSIINEQEKRRPSTITVTNESIETTTTLATKNNNKYNNNNYYHGSFSTTHDLIESEQIPHDQLLSATKTLTTTVFVEELLDFHSVSSIPCALTLLNQNEYSYVHKTLLQQESIAIIDLEQLYHSLKMIDLTGYLTRKQIFELENSN